MLFITAGMGGGTGTGAAPVIARVAKEMGILTGRGDQALRLGRRPPHANADNGLAELEANVDSLIVVLNESCSKCWATTSPRTRPLPMPTTC
jgi:cell division protein FtsZ